MQLAIDYASFLEQFFRGIGLAVVNDVLRQIRRKRSRQEEKKIVIDKSFKIALGRCSVHILPIVISVIILTVNTKQVFIGIDFQSLVKSQTINLALLQTAAKLQELLIVASLATVTFQLLRHELIHGDGLPLGLIAAGLDFTKLSYFWSPEWVGALRTSWRSGKKLRKGALMLFLIVVGVLAALAGPACAVLLVPQPQDWPAGGTTFFLNGTKDQLWPTYISAEQVVQRDLCNSDDATEHGICPSGGFYSLWAHFAQTNSKMYVEANPKYARELSGSEYYWSSGSTPPVPVRTITLGIIDGNDTSFVQPRIGTSIILSQLMQEWWQALRSKRDVTDKNVEDRAAVSHMLTPLTNVKCSNAQNLSRSDDSVMFPAPDSQQMSDRQTLSRTSLNNEPSPYLQFTWVPLPSQATSISTGAVFQSPWTADNDSRIVIGCTVRAQWVPAQIHTDAYSFWQGWYPKNISFENTYPSAKHSLLNSSSLTSQLDAIITDNDWLEMLTPKIGKSRPGYGDWGPNTIEGIIDSAHLLDGVFDDESRSPISIWQDDTRTRTKLLMTILGSVFSDGLARLHVEDAFDKTGSPANWTPSGFVKADDFEHAILQASHAVRRPTSSNNVTELRVKFSISGLSYRLTIVQKLAMAVLFLHILIAVTHTAWILRKGESSGCWDSITELLVLAQNSRPAMTALNNTAAGIKQSSTFKTKVLIRPTNLFPHTEADHLEMIYEGEVTHKDDGDVVDMGHLAEESAATELRRVSHTSTWPLRRSGRRLSPSGSMEEFPEADSTPSTPLIGISIPGKAGVLSKVQVGYAYG
ncbi:MAG: hypothetical protein Q9220_005521 [cf. Caloplaca sp. 1 TL-2023]